MVGNATKVFFAMMAAGTAFTLVSASLATQTWASRHILLAPLETEYSSVRLLALFGLGAVFGLAIHGAAENRKYRTRWIDYALFGLAMGQLVFVGGMAMGAAHDRVPPDQLLMAVFIAAGIGALVGPLVGSVFWLVRRPDKTVRGTLTGRPR